MKRSYLICLLILLFAAFTLAGCTMRETTVSGSGDQPAAPSATPEATATPEPIPTPAPIEAVIAQSSPSYVIPRDYDQLQQALEEIAQKWGFFDSAHFCHSFKKFYRESPGQFVSRRTG